MKAYTVHRIGLLSAFKFGFVVSLVILSLPIVIGTVVLGRVITAIATWMGELTYDIPLSLPGLSPIQINGVQLLKMQGVYAVMNSLAAITGWQAMIFALSLLVAVAVLVGLAADLGAVTFNVTSAISGGLALTLSEGVLQPKGARHAAEMAASSSAHDPGSAFSGPRLEVAMPTPHVHPVAKPSVLIGSDPAADIRLEGLQPQHARLTLENGRYILRDISGGQTWVQGRAITGPNMVKDGFVVRFGQWSMTFRQ